MNPEAMALIEKWGIFKDDTPEQLKLRIFCALRVVSLLRDAMQRNGDKYSGSLIPNTTSVTDILTMPWVMLCKQMEQCPSLMEDLNQPPSLDALWKDFAAFRAAGHGFVEPGSANASHTAGPSPAGGKAKP
jgi:hypothetical protein